jgi:hypothetical protein
LGISFVINHAIIKIVIIFPIVLFRRFLLEGYNIGLPFVVTHWRFGSMFLGRTFIMVVLFLPIIHQKLHVLKSLKPMHGGPRIPITTFILGNTPM